MKRLRAWPRRLLFWVRRYLPAELAGAATMLLAGLVAANLGAQAPFIAIAAVIGENVGFYGALAINVYREQRAHNPGRRRRSISRRVLLLLSAEFGAAEVLDSFLIRPLLMWGGVLLTGDAASGLLMGKVLADLVFYALAALAFTLTVRWGLRGASVKNHPAQNHAEEEMYQEVDPIHQLREGHLDGVSALLMHADLQAALAAQHTPLLVLDLDRVRDQYRRLTRALPYVRFHYAVKALDHPAVINTIAHEGGCFDVASDAEWRQLQQLAIAPERIIHTNPIKKQSEIDGAVAAGIRTFVIDNLSELAKFAARPDASHNNIRLLIRLSYPNPASKSDLSSKFGVTAHGAHKLVDAAFVCGVRIAGFSLHVGSQLDAPERFAVAIADTLALMDAIEARLPIRFEVLDIGGGFAVAYQETVAFFETIAALIGPLLEPRSKDLDIIAEPGRFVVAEAMTLFTSVVGVADRPDGRWCYLDDGIYGSYSNVVAEDVHPPIFALSEVTSRKISGTATLERTAVTLAGPTCDSADVVARCVLMPELQVGDVLVSPVMGAYTAVTATGFNGRPHTSVMCLGGRDDRTQLSLLDTQPLVTIEV